MDYNSFNSFYQNDTDNNTKKPLLIAPIVVKILPDFFIVEIAAKSGCKANCEDYCSCSQKQQLPTWPLLSAAREDNNTSEPFLIAPIVAKILPDFFIGEIAAKSGYKANYEACCPCSKK